MASHLTFQLFFVWLKKEYCIIDIYFELHVPSGCVCGNLAKKLATSSFSHTIKTLIEYDH